MIYLIIKNYLILLLSIGVLSVTLFAAGLYWIFKKPRKLADLEKPTPLPANVIALSTVKAKQEKPKRESSIKITSNDITAIAGDDILATQLDLARAYIETGRKQLAKNILKHVAAQGNAAQQAEAHRLLNL